MVKKKLVYIRVLLNQHDPHDLQNLGKIENMGFNPSGLDMILVTLELTQVDHARP